jgi:hypothetical protein
LADRINQLTIGNAREQEALAILIGHVSGAATNTEAIDIYQQTGWREGSVGIGADHEAVECWLPVVSRYERRVFTLEA